MFLGKFCPRMMFTVNILLVSKCQNLACFRHVFSFSFYFLSFLENSFFFSWESVNRYLWTGKEMVFLSKSAYSAEPYFDPKASLGEFHSSCFNFFVFQFLAYIPKIYLNTMLRTFCTQIWANFAFNKVKTINKHLNIGGIISFT